jgi:hypothetical protein
MKDLFEIQTESGQLWIDIKAQLDAKDAEHTEAIAAKDAQIAEQIQDDWDASKIIGAKHAAAITALETQHAADSAQATSELSAAKEAAELAAETAMIERAFAVAAEGRAVHNRLDALVQAGQDAHAAGDLDALGKVLVAAYAHTSKARKAKLEAELAAAQAAVTAAADKLAAL